MLAQGAPPAVPAPPPKPADPPPAFDEDLPSTWDVDLSLPGLPSLPTRGGDVVFVNGGDIVCLDAATGNLRWRVAGQTSDLVPEPPVWIADEKEPRVAVTTGDGRLLVLKAADGTVAWKAEDGARYSQAPTLGGGLLYAIDTTGAINALDPCTGEKKWTRGGVEGSVLQPVTLSPGGNSAFAVVGTKLYAFDPKTGADVWLVNLGVRPVSRPVLAGDAVFILLADGKLMAFDADPRDGKDEGIADEKPEILDRVWTVTAMAPWTAFRDREPRVVPAIIGEQIIVGEESGRIHGLACSDGHEIWKSPIEYLGGPHTPLVWRGHLLLSGQGSLSLVDSRSGKRLARATLPDLPSLQFLTLEGDRLFVTERLIDARATLLDLGPLVPFIPKE